MHLRLENIGNRKIAAIKEIRQAYGISLREAKKLADKAPVILPELHWPGEADELVQNLRSVGATVSVWDPSVLGQWASVQ